MEILGLWFVLAILVGYIASQRGRSGVGFFLLALVLSPLIALIVVLLMSPIRPPTPAPVIGTADELSKLVALRDAGHITEAEFAAQRALLMGGGAQRPGRHKCGRCGKPLSPMWRTKCEHCKATFAMYPPEPL